MSVAVAKGGGGATTAAAGAAFFFITAFFFTCADALPARAINIMLKATVINLFICIFLFLLLSHLPFPPWFINPEGFQVTLVLQGNVHSFAIRAAETNVSWPLTGKG